MSETLYDLIYDDDAVRQSVLAAFPDAKIEDARDSIHTERFSVELPADRRDDYLLHLAKSDYALSSFTLGILLRTEPAEARALLVRAGRIPAASPETDTAP